MDIGNHTYLRCFSFHFANGAVKKHKRLLQVHVGEIDGINFSFHITLFQKFTQK